eukprot:COSAG02_NODE_33224_length_503_cov_1.150990_1_plen_45_part_10
MGPCVRASEKIASVLSRVSVSPGQSVDGVADAVDDATRQAECEPE